MADAISTAISTLKLALARRPHRPLHVITSWRTLAASVEFRGTADPSLSPQHWTALATSRVITELVQNLLPQALRLDIDAESCASASCALSRCYNFAIFMHTDEGLTEAADALKLVESRFPSLLADWWEGQRAEVPKWLETNLFNDYSRYFVELFNTMSARDDDREPDNFRLCALKAHPIIQDFLLTRAIYGNSRTSEDITTTMLCLKGADPHRTPSLEELELLTVRTLLGQRPTALSNLVENLLTSPQSDMKDSPGVLKFIRWVLEYSDLSSYLVMGSDVLRHILSTTWNMHRVNHSDEDSRATWATLVISTTCRIIASSEERAPQGVEWMISEADFLCLVEKSLISTARGPNPLTAEMVRATNMWTSLHTTLMLSRRALLLPLRRDFLSLIDGLNTLSGGLGKGDVDACLTWWRKLGKAVGLDEHTLRAAEAEELKQIVGEAVGCSWVKCAFFEQDHDLKGMLRCANCRMLYCGLSCQKRDWEEGDHQSRCGSAFKVQPSNEPMAAHRALQSSKSRSTAEAGVSSHIPTPIALAPPPSIESRRVSVINKQDASKKGGDSPGSVGAKTGASSLPTAEPHFTPKSFISRKQNLHNIGVGTTNAGPSNVGRGGNASRARGNLSDRGRDRGRGGGFHGMASPPIGDGSFVPPPTYPSNSTGISNLVRAIGVKRPHFGSVGVPVAIYTNNFAAETPKSNIYQYDVVILPADKVYPWDLTMKIVRSMQEANQVFRPKGVYDGRAIFYSTKEYPFEGGCQEFEVAVPDRGDFRIRLKKVATINPVTLQSYIRGQQSHDESVLTAINACNVAVRMNPIQNNPFNVRSFFTPHGQRALGRGIMLWRGYFQSVRPSTGRMVVNLDISTGTFYKGGPLIGLCLEFLGVYGNPELHLTGRIDKRKRNDLIKFIRNLKVKTQKSGEGSKIRPIKDLSRDGADDHMFPLVDGNMTTIAAFFSMANGRALTHPKVLSVKLSSKAYVPMELCEVVEGQPMKKQVPADLFKGVLDFSTCRPEERLRSIMNGIQVLQYGNSTYLRDFGININPTPMLIQGRVLPAPVLQYAGSEIRPKNGQWNMRGKKLWKPVQICGCVMINYDSQFNRHRQAKMINELEAACLSVGITGMTQQVPVLQKDPMGVAYHNHLREAAQLHKREVGSMPNLVVVVLPDGGNEDIYYRIKNAGDIVIGVATQCLRASKCQRANMQYWANVCLKINVKLGGINVIPEASSVEFLTDPSNPVLILGCDVMHPAPGAGYNSRPSFTAVTGNVDSTSCRFLATSRAQKAGQEMVDDLEDMVYDLIMRYMAYRWDVEQKKLLAPRRIVFYRDGVSEGQFEQVVRIEVPRIRAACVRAKIPPPKLTVVVVGRRHHNRFFPANAKDAMKSGNAPTGLVIDREITNSIEFDFFLQSHGGILGTNRSAHYSCLVDENNFTADELQQLSFSLCYIYARATQSVSIVAPTYYADIVCARAKHHYDPDEAIGNLPDLASGVSSGAAEARANLYKERFRPLHPDTAQNMYFQ